MKSHNLEKKSQKRKRAFARDDAVHESNVPTLKKLLGKR